MKAVSDPLRPRVKVIMHGEGEGLEEPLLGNTWKRDSRDEHPRAGVEAVDPEPVDVDPFQYM